MPRLTLTINTDNAAFGDGDLEIEAARILQETAKVILNWGLRIGDRLPVRDINGNTVGFCLYEEAIG